MVAFKYAHPSGPSLAATSVQLERVTVAINYHDQ